MSDCQYCKNSGCMACAYCDRKPNHDRRATISEHHGKSCYYCHEPCNDLAGNPSEWGVSLSHSDDPGVVKSHHIGCVMERLNQLDELKNDIIIASGDLMVDVPMPGTDMSRVMLANSAMRRERNEAKSEVSKLNDFLGRWKREEESWVKERDEDAAKITALETALSKALPILEKVGHERIFCECPGDGCVHDLANGAQAEIGARFPELPKPAIAPNKGE